MELILDWKDLLYILSIFIGLLIGFILIFYGYKKNRDNILIGLSYVLLSYAVFLAFLIYSGYHTSFPQLYRTGNIAALSFAPLAYLYIHKIGSCEALKKTDLIHLIPVVVYIIDFFPTLFLTSSAEKAALIDAEILDPLLFVHFNQSRFFPSFFYTLGRTILIFLYWLLSVRILFRASEKMKEWNAGFGKEWLSWMRVYTFCMMLLFLPYVILSQFARSEILFDLLHLTGALLLLLSGIAVFFYPKVLYGLKEMSLSDPEISSRASGTTTYKITPDKEKLIQNQLNEQLIKNKKFLLKQYSITDLARDTSVPLYLLTKYINKNLNTNFSDLVNQHRVDACKILMTSQEYQQLTLDGIADRCGFNNRNSFYKAFKKNTGKTPAQYQKTLTPKSIDFHSSN